VLIGACVGIPLMHLAIIGVEMPGIEQWLKNAGHAVRSNIAKATYESFDRYINFTKALFLDLSKKTLDYDRLNCHGSQWVSSKLIKYIYYEIIPYIWCKSSNQRLRMRGDHVDEIFAKLQWRGQCSLDHIASHG
jgi:hypothetical protein